MHGMKPDFEAYAAPTEHPLFLAVCALVGLVGDRRRSPDRPHLRAVPRRPGLGQLPAWARRASGCGRALAGARLRRVELRLPALRRAGLRRRARSWRSCCGRRRSRPRRAAARRAGHGACSPWPGCCAPRRGCWPAPTGCGAAGARARPARARRRRAARCGRWSTSWVTGDPLLLAARHERPRRRAQPQPRAVDGAGLVRVVRRRHRAPAGRARRRSPAPCCCGGCAPGRALHVPIALFGAGVVTFLGHRASPGCRCCRAT